MKREDEREGLFLFFLPRFRLINHYPLLFFFPPPPRHHHHLQQAKLPRDVLPVSGQEREREKKRDCFLSSQVLINPPPLHPIFPITPPTPLQDKDAKDAKKTLAIAKEQWGPKVLSEARLDDVKHCLPVLPSRRKGESSDSGSKAPEATTAVPDTIQGNRDAAKDSLEKRVVANTDVDSVFWDVAATLTDKQLHALVDYFILYRPRLLPPQTAGMFRDRELFQDVYRLVYSFDGVDAAKVGETVAGVYRPDGQTKVEIERNKELGHRSYSIMAAFPGDKPADLRAVFSSLFMNAVESHLHVALGGVANVYAGRVGRYLDLGLTSARQSVGDLTFGVAIVGKHGKHGKHVCVAGFTSGQEVRFNDGAVFTVSRTGYAPNSPVALPTYFESRVQLLLTIKGAALPTAHPLAHLMARFMKRVRRTVVSLVNALLADEGEGGGRDCVLTPPSGGAGCTLADLLWRLQDVLGPDASGVLKVSGMEHDDARRTAHGAFPTPGLSPDMKDKISRLIDVLVDVWFARLRVPRNGWKAYKKEKLEKLPVKAGGGGTEGEEAVAPGENVDDDDDVDD